MFIKFWLFCGMKNVQPIYVETDKDHFLKRLKTVLFVLHKILKNYFLTLENFYLRIKCSKINFFLQKSHLQKKKTKYKKNFIKFLKIFNFHNFLRVKKV